MVKVRNFHEALEQDLQKLALEIKERGKVESGERVSEREVVKRSIQSFAVAAAAAPQAATTDEEENIVSSHLPVYLQKDDAKIKVEVEKLIDLVFHEGLERAVREAKRHPPFVEDAFHDALTDKLLPELKQRGIIK